MEFVHFTTRNGDVLDFVSKKPLIIRFSIYYVLILALILFGAYDNQAFIYFQF